MRSTMNKQMNKATLVLVLALVGMATSCTNMLQDLKRTSSGATSGTTTGTTGTGTGTLVTLSASSLSLVIGSTKSITAPGYTQAITWTSNKTSVASVADGTVTAVGAGSAIITATSADGESHAYCTVTVTATAVAVTGVSLNKSRTTLAVAGTETLLAGALPSSATDAAVTWSTSDSTVATVDSQGVVTGVAAGSAIITATTHDGGKTVACGVTVLSATYSLYALTLNKSATYVQTSSSEQLYAGFNPVFTTSQGVTWSSSNQAVAIVDQSGLVTGVAAGAATITATASGKAATCAVTVTDTANPVTAVSLALNKTTARLVPDGYEQLSPVITPATATGQSVVWTSSAPAYATVDQTGLVHGVAAGTATVTATNGSFTANCTVTVSSTPNDWKMVRGSTDDRVLAAAADSGQSNPGVWVSNDYGYTWKQVFATGVWAVSVSASGQNMVLHGNLILKYSHDYGNTWTDSSIADKASIEGSAMSDDGTIVYAAQYQNSTGGAGALWKSTDGGVTFAKTTALDQFNTVSCSSDGTVVSAGTVYSSNKLYHSTDGGSTFTAAVLSSQNSSEIRRLLMAKSGSQVIAGDEYGWLKSSSGTNLWSTWSAFYGSSSDKHKIGQLTATYNTDGTFSTIYVSGSYTNVNPSNAAGLELGILKSTDLGATWTTVLASASAGSGAGSSIGVWTTLLPASDGKIMVATSGSSAAGGIYVTLDGSATSPTFVRRY